MTKTSNGLVDFHDIFSNTSLLDYDEDSKFIECYLVEGSMRIDELSRQLRTFLNYKSAIIRFRYSNSSEVDNILKKEPIMKLEFELSSLFHRYVNLLKKIGIEDGIIMEKVLILIEKVKAQPSGFEINLLKEIKHLGVEIWKRFHILSELELQSHPQLLNVVIRIAGILCNAEGAFFSPFSDFYRELKQSYLQLEVELSGLLHLNEEVQFKEKKKKRRVRIV